MSRLIESIRLCDGEFSRLEFHQARVDHAFRQIYKSNPTFTLETLLKNCDIPTEGLYKCRVVYDDKTTQVEFSAYQLRSVKTLKLITDNKIEYAHKWEDRSQLDALYSLRSDCDDILIVKNGLITDTFYTNIVFERNGSWFTPQSCLLPGIMRQYLLNTGVIEQRIITAENFRSYNKFKLINAMLQFDGLAFDISNIS